MTQRLQLFFLWLVGFTVALPSHAAGIAPREFFGTWRIVKVVGLAQVSGGPPFARLLLGKTVVIAPEKLSINVDSWWCNPGGFFTRRVDTAGYLDSQTGTPLEEVMPPAPYPSLSEKMTILDSSGCIPVFWLGRDYVELEHGGVFAIAKRVHHAPK